MNTQNNEKQPALSEEEIQLIVHHWIRILNIKLGWIHEFDKYVVNYVMFVLFLFHLLIVKHLFVVIIIILYRQILFLFLTHFFHHQNYAIRSLDTLAVCMISIFQHLTIVNSFVLYHLIKQFVYGILIATNKFNPINIQHLLMVRNFHHIIIIIIVKMSFVFHHMTKPFDFKNNKQLQIFNEHTNGVCGIEFSSFSGGRYLCSGSYDRTVRLWDVETPKSLHVFNGHKNSIWCVDISPLQSNNNSNKINSIGVIGGNGYTICSGSHDETICIWDIETAKQIIVFKGHKGTLRRVKYGSNELLNTILSGSNDKSICLWDIRSGQQIQMFNGHKNEVWAVEYSPFVIMNNSEVVRGNSNVICSGSRDGTIRFWDIRLNKNELHVIEDKNGIMCLKFFQLKKNMKNKNDNGCSVNLCYSSFEGPVCIWG
ncbi:G-protein beta WD-40 repeats containing protein [Reticulomyxa filosa]|uniref:G-protein beta WD-40 repeats containing protein n=1 Tax=Reticulomyxa filosa TaxID=46433 RepID=X6LNX0_RETFI|nr:G-protein beta WD-40 repeats containing protein [Reticulomyxa filosa]|eukprot:ETO02395.1 G-protein beta WD-40 repeats containing protein [Reticulomyxa filosa]